MNNVGIKKKLLGTGLAMLMLLSMAVPASAATAGHVTYTFTKANNVYTATTVASGFSYRIKAWAKVKNTNTGKYVYSSITSYGSATASATKTIDNSKYAELSGGVQKVD